MFLVAKIVLSLLFPANSDIAYLGAAADIASKDYLTAAGSILTVEARHSSYLRAQLGEPPFPSSYDTPLDFDQVHSLASQFFVGCPTTNPKLGFTAFPKLTSTATGPVTSGQTVTLLTPNYVLTDPNGSTSGQLYGAFMTPTGPIFVPVCLYLDLNGNEMPKFAIPKLIILGLNHC